MSEAQLWGLAAGGILTRLNSEDFGALRCLGGRRASRECLRDAWSVNDDHELTDTLEWLWTEGHGAECREVCRSVRRGEYGMDDGPSGFGSFVHSHLEQLEANVLLGWDLCRLINVARWGFTGAYMEEAQAWFWILRAARRVQTAFPSWADFGRDFLLGYEYWRLGTAAKFDVDLTPHYEWLLKSHESPWKRLAWNTSLSEE